MQLRKPKTPEQIALEKAIADIHAHMVGCDVDSPEYATCATHLKDLHALLEHYRSERINPNVVITTVGSLAGVLTIVNYERFAVFVSKAYAHVPKPK